MPGRHFARSVRIRYWHRAKASMSAPRNFVPRGAQRAMTDVLRLSRGMTYKAAICEVPYGDGKSVIIADPCPGKTPTLLHAIGRIIENLGGRYITADDVGTTLAVRTQ
jgi:hypothetical protein